MSFSFGHYSAASVEKGGTRATGNGSAPERRHGKTHTVICWLRATVSVNWAWGRLPIVLIFGVGLVLWLTWYIPYRLVTPADQLASALAYEKCVTGDTWRGESSVALRGNRRPLPTLGHYVDNNSTLTMFSHLLAAEHFRGLQPFWRGATLSAPLFCATIVHLLMLFHATLSGGMPS